MVEISEAPLSRLAELAEVSIAFESSSVLEIAPADGGAFTLREISLEAPLSKDYDLLPDNHPRDWLQRFDTRNWGLLFAVEAGRKLGAAVIAFQTPAVEMLEGRADLAVLWDIRVQPGWRGKGIGNALFQAVLEWAKKRVCTELKIETQNNNPAAVRFYIKQGCELRRVVDNAYPGLPGEQMLLLYKRL